jgi:xanthosine utilization system XapX-like protein
MRGALCIAAVALACLTFSVDEIAEIHERLGAAADVLMSSGTRHGTALWSTGLWPFLIGVPVIAMLAIAVRGTRHIFLGRAPGALALLIVGFVVMFTGAVVVELGANLVDAAATHGGWFLTQVVAEELLEMLGVTLIAWSASSLLQAYGFELRQPAAAPERLVEVTVRPAAAACASVRSVGS